MPPKRLARRCLDHWSESNRDAGRIRVESIVRSNEALWRRTMCNFAPHGDFGRCELFDNHQRLSLPPSPAPALSVHSSCLLPPTHTYVACIASYPILYTMRASRLCGRLSRGWPWFALDLCAVAIVLPLDLVEADTSLAWERCKRLSRVTRLRETFFGFFCFWSRLWFSSFVSETHSVTMLGDSLKEFPADWISLTSKWNVSYFCWKHTERYRRCELSMFSFACCCHHIVDAV